MPAPILSIDDDEDALAGLRAQLRRKHGIQSEMALSMEAAEQHLRSRRFSLLVVDMRFLCGEQMDGAAGMKLLTRLRANVYGELNRQTSDILLTAEDFYIDVLEDRFAGQYDMNLFRQYQIGRYGKGTEIVRLASVIAEAVAEDERRHAGTASLEPGGRS